MGQITGKDNNRVPTVKECNDAYGGNYMTESQVAEAISDATANFLTSTDFKMAFGAASGYIKFPNGFMIQAGHGGREPPQSKLVMKHMVSMQVLYRGGGLL